MKRLFLISLVALSVVCLSSCQLARLKRVRVAPGPVKVTVMEVNSSTGVNKRSYVGTVEASKTALASAVHGGVVQSLDIVQGQFVDTTAILVEISSSTLENTYKAASAALRQARDGYDRASKVFASGSISELKMVELQSRLAQAEASFSAAGAALEECRVKAPFAGRISEVFVHCGERVTPAAPLFSIVDERSLEVVVAVPEGEVSDICERSGASVVFPALGNRQVRAKVKSKALVSNTLSHSYKCSLRLLDTPSGLMSGMVCKVYMDSDVIKGIVIPSDVIKLSSDDRYVWIVDEDSRVVRRQVTVGGYSGRGVIISEGLDEGDRIILEGMDKVSEGMTVRIGGVKVEY
ncbi:MAG: efflux RND transporter periplasmic adaptor subunit [Bacteroidales bacterium]|nr:efflux RND transporter periplasmic adaptor subunit [Candidatus Hennigimonas equi]